MLEVFQQRLLISLFEIPRLTQQEHIALVSAWVGMFVGSLENG